MQQENSRQGWHYAVACYLMWGLFPIYWSPLNDSAVTPEQILAHRVIWSAVLSVGLLIFYKKVDVVLSAFRQPKLLGVFFASSFLIAVNWLVYLWAIGNHRILDASLGYFINPLVNVFLGCLIFKEQLNRTKIIALLFAVLGIVWLAIPAGQMPWVAILLAGSFAGYAVIRKLAPMEALTGLALETILLFPLAFGYLLWHMMNGTLVFSQLNSLQMSVLVGAGVATTLPLLCFAEGARRISMSLLGMLQYISPTLQFLCGWLIFGEQFTTHKMVGFALVWLGVILFLMNMRVNKKAA